MEDNVYSQQISLEERRKLLARILELSCREGEGDDKISRYWETCGRDREIKLKSDRMGVRGKVRR